MTEPIAMGVSAGPWLRHRPAPGGNLNQPPPMAARQVKGQLRVDLSQVQARPGQSGVPLHFVSEVGYQHSKSAQVECAIELAAGRAMSTARFIARTRRGIGDSPLAHWPSAGPKGAASAAPSGIENGMLGCYKVAIPPGVYSKVEITVRWPHVACISPCAVVLDKPAPRRGALYRTAARCRYSP